jgi:hypothetical protein
MLDERELCCVWRSYVEKLVKNIIVLGSRTTSECCTYHQWYAYHSLKTTEIDYVMIILVEASELTHPE